MSTLVINSSQVGSAHNSETKRGRERGAGVTNSVDFTLLFSGVGMVCIVLAFFANSFTSPVQRQQLLSTVAAAVEFDPDGGG